MGANSKIEWCTHTLNFWGDWHADALLCTEAKPGGLCPPPAMKIGKRKAGRLLDGIEHNGMPAPCPLTLDLFEARP